MLIPPIYAMTEPSEWHRVMTQRPLGMLITQRNGLPEVDHLPFEFDATAGELGTLSAHVDRANPVWHQAGKGSEVMVVFRGSEGYISPGWYPSKQETHRFVPTWNYEVVHVRGTLRVVDDERFVRGMVARLTRRHEALEPKPWKMGDSAPSFISEMLSKIVGLEIAITHIEGMSKLSQNREQRDFSGALIGLRSRGEADLANSMERLRTEP